VLGVACLATAAAADPLSITTDGDLPFSRAELESALAARVGLADAGAASHLDARITGDAHRVEIAVAGRTRAVELAGERGPDAARLVAFSILDLAGDRLDPPASDSEPAPLLAPRVIAGVTPAPSHERWSLALWAVAGTRESGVLEINAPVTPRMRIVGSAGITRERALGTMDHAASVRGVPVRASVATRFGGLELRLGAGAVVEHAIATRSSTDVLVGAGAGAAYVLPITRGFEAIAGAGADAFANRIDYRVDGVHVATTERFAWWAGIALGRSVTW
jgi:hypothetical protein